MKEYAVSDVVAMLQVNEETVRRWIRKGKLPVTRKAEHGKSLIALEDIVRRANLKPHIYHEPMIKWLEEKKIKYSLQEELQETDTVNRPSLKDRYGALYALVSSSSISVPKIVLHTAQEEQEADCESSTNNIEPKAVCSEEIKDATDADVEDTADIDIKEKILAEKKKLIRLEQDLARVNAEISVCKGEIEYYTLLLENV